MNLELDLNIIHLPKVLVLIKVLYVIWTNIF